MPAGVPARNVAAMNGYGFTDGLRHALARARDEASDLDHESVGTEDILLALLADVGGTAESVIRHLDADPDAIRTLVLQTATRGKRPVAAGPDLPYTWRGKKVLELAMAEARELHHPCVGTEHLLLGLLREEKGIAAQALVRSGVTLERARAATLRLLGDPRA